MDHADVVQHSHPKVKVATGFVHNHTLTIVAAIIIIIIIAIVASVVSWKIEQKLKNAEMDRIECPGISDEDCGKLLCFFEKVKKGPSCYMQKNRFGYKVKNVTEEENGPLIHLKRTAYETPYGISFKNVVFKMTYLTENILRFQFKDADHERYEVPVQKDFPLLQNPPEVNMDNLTYKVIHTNNSEVFNFGVQRKDGTYLWDTRIGALLLSDQYLQIGSFLPSSNIYGLGEQVHDTLRHKMDFVSWPMFARDRPAVAPSEHANLYGTHPFYTCLENSGASHGVLFLNSNAMEVTLMPAPAITFRTIGGILDFFIFVGDNPEHVIQLYTSLIGRPMMPPYWSLGFQLSRYGYETQSNLVNVLNRTRGSKIPLAVQFLDIDHMDSMRDFTYNKKSFPGLPDFIEKQKSENRLKWVIILDPAIPSGKKDYSPYTSGLEKSVYVKKAPFWEPWMFLKYMQDVNVTFGKVWPQNYSAFPDFFLEETKEWWKENIVQHRKEISFDGLWIDMNEPANFETNHKTPKYCSDSLKMRCWALRCPRSKHDDPPYNPLKESGTNRLSQKTLCMSSVQGSSDTEYLHYDVHSLYGWSQSQPTLEAAQEATGTRSLVISRSTYPSSGRYAGHWLGDNHSTFEDLKRSIIGILEFNLFGIPYVGADVCGFFENASPDLCKRWMQLGAFYPFYRNHNSLGQLDQDPGYYSMEVREASRKAAERRITLNPYLYTLFYRAHVDGSTVVRPVFHEFPEDKMTWDMSQQFMWGKSMLITPIVDENEISGTMYLPKDEWWHFNYEQSYSEKKTQFFIIDSDANEYTPLHIRGGSIIPIAKYDWEAYPEFDNITQREMDLYIFPKEGKSTGELFMDDGISKDTIEEEAYALYTFQHEDCKLTVESKENSNFKGPKPFLKRVVIFKVKSATKASDDKEVKMDEELNVVIVTVDSEMSELTELTWEDAEGACSMLD